jgi:predicted translin family RNA/ssDNA-binding protein
MTERTLANVLLDLHLARERHRELDRECQRAAWKFDRAREDRLSDQMSDLDKEVDSLRDEFATLFRAATGVQWAQVDAAIQAAEL